MSDTPINERVAALEAWSEQYPKNVDFVLNAINQFLCEKHPELVDEFESSLVEWFKAHLKEE